MNQNLEIIPLSSSAYIHVSYSDSEWGRIPSNGLVLVQEGEAFLFDTPMDIECTKVLVKYIKDSLKARITGFVPNHWHADCAGGLAYLHQIGVKSYANEMTIKFMLEKGFEVPQHGFETSLNLRLGNLQIECFYPGAAHSLDNIVVWIPKEKILFAGCMVKELKTKNIGNIADADTQAWPVTIQKIIEKFPEVQIVIPGHGAFGGKELLSHTLEITRSYTK